MELIDKNEIDFITIETDDYNGNEIIEVALKEDIEEILPIKAIPIDQIKQVRGEIQKRATIAMNERYKQGLRSALEIIDKLIKEYEREVD